MPPKKTSSKPTTTTNITFDLKLLSNYQQTEQQYHRSQWLTSDILPTIDIFTDNEANTYVSRLQQCPHLSYVHQLLSYDPRDLDDLIEEPPIKMKRYQRVEFLTAINEIKNGTRQQPPMKSDDDLTDLELKNKLERSILSVKVDLVVTEISGIHSSSWPIVVEPGELHFLTWFLLTHQKLIKNKSVVEVGAGSCPLTSLALSNLKVPKQCFITSNNESCDESVTNTLHKNCEWQKNDDDNASSTIRLETFDWEQDNDYQKVMDMINDQCDIIIGSDILNYTLNIPRRLLDTICKMMVNSASSRSDVKFICSHSMKFGRSHLDSIENYCMEELNMKMNVIEWKSFVPEPIPLPISNYGRRDVVILVFQLLYPN